MKLLLSLPNFHIKPRSNTTATMFLSPSFDLFIDVNKNPGSWPAQRKRGGLRTEISLRGGQIPDDDIEEADKLIKAYQKALVDQVLELEDREAKDLEEIRPPKRASSRTQAPASSPAPPADPEESPSPEPEKPSFSNEEAAALEILTAATPDQEEARVQEEDIFPDEPDLEALEEEEGEESSGADPEEVKEEEVQDKKEEILPEWDEKDQALEKKIEAIKEEDIIERLLIQENKINLLEGQIQGLDTQAQFIKMLEHGLQPEDSRTREPEPEPENEIKITRNSKGYSWVITSRAASLDEAFINAIKVNEDLNKVLNPKSE